MPESLKKAVPFIVLLGLTCLLFAGGLFSDKVIRSYDDTPVTAAVMERLQADGAGGAGWHDQYLAGYPSPPYPMNLRWLTWQLFSPVGHLTASYFLAVLLAGCFFFLFLRSFPISRQAALFGAVGMLLTNSLITLILPGHLGKLLAFAWLPLVFLFLRRAALGDKWTSYVYAGFFLGLSAQGLGHEMTLFFGFLATAYYLFLLLSRRPAGTRIPAWLTAGRSLLLRHLGAALAAPLVAVLVAFVILPSVRQSVATRSAGSPVASVNAQQKWDWATQWSLPPEEIIDFVVPGLFGWKTGDKEYPYFGRLGRSADDGKTQPNLKLNAENLGLVLVLLLVLALLVRARDLSAETKFWLWTLLIALALALGKYLFAPFWVLHQLPILDSIRNPNKFVQIVAFAAAVLGAFGFACLFDPERRADLLRKLPAFRTFLKWTLIALGALFLLSFFLMDTVSDLANGMTRNYAGSRSVAERYPLAFLLAAALAGLVWYVATRLGKTPPAPRTATVLGAVLIAALGCELWLSGRHFVDFDAQPNYGKPDALSALFPRDQGRVLFTEQNNYSQYYLKVAFPLLGVPNVDLQLLQTAGGRYETLSTALGKNPRALFDALGTHWLVSMQPADALRTYFPDVLEHKRFPLGQQQNLYVHRLSNASPRAWLARGWRVAADPAAVGAWLGSTNARPGIACLEHAFSDAVRALPAPTNVSATTAGPGSVRIVKYANNRVELDVAAAQPTVLVMQDYYDAGWEALVDGKPVKTFPVNLAARGVAVPGGRHAVEFRFRPEWPHANVTLAGYVLVALVALFDLARRLRRRDGSVAGGSPPPDPGR